MLHHPRLVLEPPPFRDGGNADKPHPVKESAISRSISVSSESVLSRRSSGLRVVIGGTLYQLVLDGFNLAAALSAAAARS